MLDFGTKQHPKYFTYAQTREKKAIFPSLHLTNRARHAARQRVRLPLALECEPGSDEPAVGQLALVNFGRREAVGVIVACGRDRCSAGQAQGCAGRAQPACAAVAGKWLALAGFAADYYQRPLGEVALPGLPKNLRVLTTVALDRALKKLAKLEDAARRTPAAMPVLNPPSRRRPTPSAAQASRRCCCTA
jgi:primosomal protein N'